jgi:hypothetical protein
VIRARRNSFPSVDLDLPVRGEHRYFIEAKWPRLQTPELTTLGAPPSTLKYRYRCLEAGCGESLPLAMRLNWFTSIANTSLITAWSSMKSSSPIQTD